MTKLRKIQPFGIAGPTYRRRRLADGRIAVWDGPGYWGGFAQLATLTPGDFGSAPEWMDEALFTQLTGED